MTSNSWRLEIRDGMAGHSLKHWSEYALYRGLAGGLSLAPEAWADRGGAGLGWLLARVAPIRWGVVRAQLERAFPEADGSWVRKVGRRSYAHLGAEVVSMLRMASKGPDQVKAQTDVVNFGILQDAVREGTGAVVVTGHLGNWEVGGASIAARGLPVDVVAARQRNLLFDRHLTGSREGLGMTVIPRGEARTKVLAALRAGRIVGILGDQDARSAGVFVDFFGSPASTARGPALFALRANAPLILGVVRREPGPRPQYTVTFERVQIEPSHDLKTDIVRLTQAFTSRLEAYIREAPEQYFWMHKRWKTSPPTLAAAPPE